MNYEKIIKENQFKSKIVLATYIFILLFVGFIIDIRIYLNIVSPDLRNSTGVIEISQNLLSLSSIPYRTLISFLIAIISIIYTIKRFEKILLKNSSYIEIDETTKNDNKEYKKLFNMLEELRISANLSFKPKLFVIKENYLNAFASGWNKDNSIIVLTEGLINKLNKEELQAVMAHELSHIIHEDIKLTLVVSVLSSLITNILYFRVIGGSNKNSSGKKGGNIIQVILLLLYIIFPILSFFLSLYLSRKREYLADAGAVKLTRDNEPLKSALLKIDNFYKNNNYSKSFKKNKSRDSMLFFNPYELFSTHPSIENRIEKLSW